MLTRLLTFLTKTFLKPLNEVEKILCDILLLPDLLPVVVIVDHIVEHWCRIHVFLVSEHEVRHELLQVRGHDCTLLLTRQDLKFLFLCLPFVGVFRLNILREFCLLSILIRDVCVEELQGNIGQEKESLDE